MSGAPEIDFTMVHVDDLETNEYNPNAMEQDMFDILSETIKEEGMVQPILVRPNPNDDGPRYMVVDGEHRFRAAVAAGMDEVAVVVMPYSEDEAKMRTISMNNLKGQYIPLKMAKLLADLQDRHTPADIRRMTGIKEEEFKSLSALLEVPDIDFGDSLTVSMDSTDRPINVSILLMPEEHDDYTQGMINAMEIAGPMVVPLAGAEVGAYDKAMTSAFDLAGTKLRNVGLATICRVYNALPPKQKEDLIAEVYRDTIPKG